MIRRIRMVLRRSIRWQLIAGVALVHAVLMSVFVWDLVQRQEAMLHDEVVRGTEDLIEGLDRSVALWLAAGDYQAVQDALEAVKERYPDIRTLMVLDRQGRVVAHLDETRLGRYVVDAPMRRLMNAASTPHQVVRLHESAHWLDMASPIFLEGQLLGWIRLQRDLSALETKRLRVLVEGALYTLFAIVVGGLIAWWLGNRLTRRLDRLQMITRRVAEGDRQVSVPQEREYDDELAHLSHHFAQMLEVLNRQEQALVLERERLNTILSLLPEAVAEVDGTGRIRYANPMLSRLTGRPMSRLEGEPILSVLALRDEHGHPLWQDSAEVGALSRPMKQVVQVEALTCDGVEESMLMRVVPHDNVRGEHRVVLLMEYLSESQHLLDELAWQTDHDPLTQLYNRAALERHLHQLLDALSSQSSDATLQTIQFNLDHFKQVNEVAGFSVGDQLLQELGQLLYARLGQKGFLARLNGDDFVVVLNQSVGDVRSACQLARSLIDEVARYPFSWRDQRFVMSMRAGVLSVNPGLSVEEILLKLDFTVRLAREKGDGHCIVYREGMINQEEKFAQVRMLNELKRALREDSFELFCQPVVALDGSAHRTGEVLVRLRDHQGDLVSPFHFLPVAERFGLMVELDLLIVRKALAWLVEHPDALDQMNINLSGMLLQQQRARVALLDEVRRLDLHIRRKVCFEVTETAAIYDISDTAALLAEIRALGSRVAIDDFGSGYASFSYLKSLPADFVKIDGAFVRHLESDRVNLAMVRAVTEVAHEMGMQVVAEFVENEQVVRMLKTLEVEFGQGYYFSPPVPLAELEDRLWRVTLA